MDVTKLIRADHDALREVFGKLRSGTQAERALLLPVATSMIVAHSRAEESQVYPVARQEAGEIDEVAHSQEEHAEAEQVLARLIDCDLSDRAFERLLSELVDDLTHHMKDEEESVLPGMQDRLSAGRLSELGSAFLAARRQHWGDQPMHPTRDDLVTQAQNMGIPGATTMNKPQLQDEVEPQ